MLNILGGASKDSHKELMKCAVAIPTASLHMYGKEPKPARKIGHITIVSTSMSQAESLIAPLVGLNDAMRAERKGLPVRAPLVPAAVTSPSPRPLIAVTMGSDSDLPVLKPGSPS